MGSPLANSISLAEVTCSDIDQIINTVKNGAAGYDEIKAYILKLVYSCNLSFVKVFFPMN